MRGGACADEARRDVDRSGGDAAAVPKLGGLLVGSRLHGILWPGRRTAGATARDLAAPLGIAPESRQGLMGGRAAEHLARLALEAGDQADLSLRAAHLVPGQPNAVGVAQLRLAVVTRPLLGWEDELLLGERPGGIVHRGVEGVDRQRAVHPDRLLVFVAVKHDPPAVAADARLARLAQHRVGPHVAHPRGDLGLRVLSRPGEALREVPLAAAAQQQHKQHHGGTEITEKVGGHYIEVVVCVLWCRASS